MGTERERCYLSVQMQAWRGTEIFLSFVNNCLGNLTLDPRETGINSGVYPRIFPKLVGHRRWISLYWKTFSNNFNTFIETLLYRFPEAYLGADCVRSFSRVWISLCLLRAELLLKHLPQS